jgi:hypothetical protein
MRAARVIAMAGLTIMLPGSAQAFCSVFDGRPCAPAFCSVFDEGPCLPDIPYPFSDSLRLTVQSRPPERRAPRPDTPLNTISELFDALRVCWIPPPLERSSPGTQITIRFSLNRAGHIIGEPHYTYSTPSLSPEVRSAYQQAIAATLRRCTPFSLSAGLGGAIAGRPIAARFVDDRELRRTEKPDER